MVGVDQRWTRSCAGICSGLYTIADAINGPFRWSLLDPRTYAQTRHVRSFVSLLLGDWVDVTDELADADDTGTVMAACLSRARRMARRNPLPVTCAPGILRSRTVGSRAGFWWMVVCRQWPLLPRILHPKEPQRTCSLHAQIQHQIIFLPLFLITTHALFTNEKLLLVLSNRTSTTGKGTNISNPTKNSHVVKLHLIKHTTTRNKYFNHSCLFHSSKRSGRSRLGIVLRYPLNCDLRLRGREMGRSPISRVQKFSKFGPETSMALRPLFPTAALAR